MSEDSENPRLLCQLNMVIALTKHLHTDPKKEVEIKNIHVTDDALRPKSFNVRLEQGNFPLPEDLSYNGPGVSTPYTKPLLFDHSPYPPESEWKESWLEGWKEPEGHNYWDEKNVC
jgi:hypothetical protein